MAQNKNVNSMCFNVTLQTSLLRDKKEALKFEKKWETELKIVWFQTNTRSYYSRSRCYLLGYFL